MITNLLITALLTVVLAMQGTSESQDWDCTMYEGVPYFNLEVVGNVTFPNIILCGKKFYVPFMSGTKGDYSCVVGQFNCLPNGTVTGDSIIFQSGKKITRTSRLRDLNNGVVMRETLRDTGEVVTMFDIVTSFSVSADGEVKVGYYICGPHTKDDNRYMRAIISTNKDAVLTDEVVVMNKLLPYGGLFAVPNDCNVDDFY